MPPPRQDGPRPSVKTPGAQSRKTHPGTTKTRPQTLAPPRRHHESAAPGARHPPDARPRRRARGFVRALRNKVFIHAHTNRWCGVEGKERAPNPSLFPFPPPHTTAAAGPLRGAWVVAGMISRLVAKRLGWKMGRCCADVGPPPPSLFPATIPLKPLNRGSAAVTDGMNASPKKTASGRAQPYRVYRRRAHETAWFSRFDTRRGI